MGLLYLKKSGFVNNLNIDAIRRKSMNSILNLSFYQKSGIPEKEGEMASLIRKYNCELLTLEVCSLIRAFVEAG